MDITVKVEWKEQASAPDIFKPNVGWTVNAHGLELYWEAGEVRTTRVIPLHRIWEIEVVTDESAG